ncbi:MAG: NAD(P)-binding protein [Leadbetterella sp.]|nr:NAD(P)-binding protein [Leadbetterella sp.]
MLLLNIIGSSFSGLSAAAYAAGAEQEVYVFEKHGQPGDRARQFFIEQGYVFHMGAGWYGMPLLRIIIIPKHFQMKATGVIQKPIGKKEYFLPPAGPFTGGLIKSCLA